MFRGMRAIAARAAKKKARRGERNKPTKPKMVNEPIYQYPVSTRFTQRVYVWGLAEHGGLGVGDKELKYYHENVHYCDKPTRLSFGEFFPVEDIATGYGFSVFAVRSEDKDIVYGSGINTDSQIGYHTTDDKSMKRTPVILKPRPINLPLKKLPAKVTSLAAGRAHLLILTDHGLYTLGNNCYGQCGRYIIDKEDYYKSHVVFHIPNVEDKKIISVAAGQDHSILLTEGGEVYSFGWGADGQTGLGHYRNEHKPSLVHGDIAGEKIVKIACIADCVLALSDKGKIFGWGNAEYFQIPTRGDVQQINVATELPGIENLGPIVDIACGSSFCMALNSEGMVYVWGFGILGLGPEVSRLKKPTLVPPTLFGINAYERNCKVTKIFCGMYQLAAVTDSNNLYMWGRNKFGCLGLGHMKDQFFPFKVSLGAGVLKVCCGIDHTVAICKPFM